MGPASALGPGCRRRELGPSPGGLEEGEGMALVRRSALSRGLSYVCACKHAATGVWSLLVRELRARNNPAARITRRSSLAPQTPRLCSPAHLAPPQASAPEEMRFCVSGDGGSARRTL
ncbi:uncharacterized protein LOC116418719 [Piliocolobus tephrosceles]|uniref:uncharacterized protein LOC116418719 n=1 Tax=Piliocolobus tephrosceles TaxID=591936 RepID=UPI0013010989|nr:uncharacterized protein LOC116418719 [Piliocolobus tephrosceles]XP_031791085.1 uncharacterized protein LOC116418719 [Piliocolobus tephrosceles]